MDESEARLARAIGARLKRERTALAWTLDHLAEVSGVSRRMVINVEQGASNPSVGTLLRLSDALGVGLPALVERPAARTGTVTRRGDGATLWTGDRGGRGILVAGTEPPNIVELWDWSLEPGERHESEPHSAGTWELLFVVAGAMTVEVAGSPNQLGTGDAVSFPGDVAHAYASTSDDPARFALTVFQPRVGRASAAVPR